MVEGLRAGLRGAVLVVGGEAGGAVTEGEGRKMYCFLFKVMKKEKYSFHKIAFSGHLSFACRFTTLASFSVPMLQKSISSDGGFAVNN